MPVYPSGRCSLQSMCKAPTGDFFYRCYYCEGRFHSPILGCCVHVTTEGLTDPTENGDAFACLECYNQPPPQQPSRQVVTQQALIDVQDEEEQEEQQEDQQEDQQEEEQEKQEEEEQEEPTVVAQKCTYRMCKVKSTTMPLFPCASHKCDSGLVHDVCFNHMLASKNIPSEERSYGDTSERTCNKSCHNLHVKTIKDKELLDKFTPSQRVDWNKDGSMRVLLDIITTEGNWEHFQGGGFHGGRTRES
jgi:hypothetical protein